MPGRIAILLSTFAVAVAACTGGSGSTPGFTFSAPSAASVASSGSPAALAGSTAGASQAVTLVLKEYTITPAAVTIRAGIPVSFVAENAGAINHALMIVGSGVSLTTKDLAFQPGVSETIVGTLAAGTYTFFCPVDGHAGLGMKGTITVTP